MIYLYFKLNYLGCNAIPQFWLLLAQKIYVRVNFMIEVILTPNPRMLPAAILGSYFSIISNEIAITKSIFVLT